MATLQQIQSELSGSSATIVTIGNFDGVHLGHQSIFQQMISHSKNKSLSTVVLILYPHPKEIFTGSSPALLTTLEDRKKMIRSLGIENVFDFSFDLKTSEISAKDLLRSLVSQLHMKHFCIGPTTHIGKNREGTPEKIVKFSKELDFEISTLELLQIKGCKVSSSIIRDCISRGEMRLAADMLGRFYSTQGVVESGMGKGKLLGYPTANLDHLETMVPACGVYAGYTWVDGKKYKSAINIGTRPTITDSKKIVVEPHILDFDKKIVGKSIEIQWVERLREEIKFESIDQLKIQIQNDVRKSMNIL